MNRASQTPNIQALVTRSLGLALSLTIVGITLLSILSSRGWSRVLELASSFKLQYLLISLILTGLIAFTRQKRLLLLACLCLGINAMEILPWYLPSRVEARGASELRILLANVNTQNKSYDQVLSWVRREQPDVAVFIETSVAWVKQLNGLTDLLPYSFSRFKERNLGIAIFSKVPLERPSINWFEAEKNPGPSVVANLRLQEQTLALIATHPLPPISPDFFQDRNRQLQAIAQYVRQLKTPVLLLGDLNLTMWSPYYRKFIGETGLRNARQGFGVLPSWPSVTTYPQVPALLSSLLRIPIDHCLLSPNLGVKTLRIGPEVGSDHLPLLINLLIPQAPPKQSDTGALNVIL
ncbi:endonuclease/exonuclease/phosphatase family protein [Leptolyngbya sp. FACHB-261]|uniref:endonuclease/exonuclease/phosphatase family protein n=1 Tax=Leptolyngbya sp. FACHB-261 TaxID=2692806 RepID=UPI0016842C10|nr:endonuclease/exonuclease/phosphatase family protein [Leptolyngbya sp. FACHB-261]MBD2099504.1 endonuclease/exonuclease/phosphatase family protein [Leptolyngbya sp. FACHB-261]